MKSIREVSPGIFRIRQTIGRFKFSVNIYVIVGKDGLIFDAGFGGNRAANFLIKALAEVAFLCENRETPCRITRAMASHSHWDHFSGLHNLQKSLGLEILATKKQGQKINSIKNYNHFFWENNQMLDPVMSGTAMPGREFRNHLINLLCIALFKVRFVPGKITLVSGHDSLEINRQSWEIIKVPGHCDDDIALFNRETGILLCGDLVFKNITTWLGPMKSDLKAYIKSLKQIQQLPGLKLILPAHGSPITDPYSRIQEAVDHRIKRTDQIFNMILASGNKGLSFNGVYRRCYPGKQLQRALLGGWIVVTLKYLLDQQKIVSVKKGRKLIFLPKTMTAKS